MTNTIETLANETVALKQDLSSKAGLADSSPVKGISHTGLAMWYALKVNFDSPLHDPNGLAKFIVIKYEQDNHDALFFKNGKQKKLKNTLELSNKLSAFIQ